MMTARPRSAASIRLRRESRSAREPSSAAPKNPGMKATANVAAAPKADPVRSSTSSASATRAIWSPASLAICGDDDAAELAHRQRAAEHRAAGTGIDAAPPGRERLPAHE